MTAQNETVTKVNSDDEFVIEEPKEIETNATADTKPRYKDAIEMSSVDATLNCIVSEHDVIDSLPIDGTSLIACARANIGLTGGRYYFEVEILSTKGTNAEVLVGVSCAGSSLFLGDKDTICFSSIGSCTVDGEKVNSFRGRRANKDDILGVLINRTDKGNARTVSLFVNGQRAGRPQEIPTSVDGAVYPHVGVRNAMVSVNLTKHIFTKLPFTVQMVGDANTEHVTPNMLKEAEEAKLVIPVGLDSSNWVKNYVSAHAADHYVVVTNESIAKWQERSGVPKKTLDQDGLRCLDRMLTLRKRNYIYSIGHNLLAADRENLNDRFPNFIKKVFVCCPSILGKMPFNVSFFKDASLPKSCEGIAVEHTEGEDKSRGAMDVWQKRCKQQSLVTNFKVGSFFKEQWGTWEKLRDATREFTERKLKDRAEAERRAQGGEHDSTFRSMDSDSGVPPSKINCTNFSDEDWMLLDLRVELHLLIHAFRQDVEDKDRQTFAAEHMPHYYKLYHEAKKSFNVTLWGSKTVAEAVEPIKDTIEVKDTMLIAKHDISLEFDTIIQMVEKARQHRNDCVGAGDESAQLKFKAPARPAVAKYKGYKGAYKGAYKNYTKGTGTTTPAKSTTTTSGSTVPVTTGTTPAKATMKGKGTYTGWQNPMGGKAGKRPVGMGYISSASKSTRTY